MTAPRILRLNTANPAGATLAVMGRNATAAANTWTMREWAARLAAKGPPRDYVAQLRNLYEGIVERWRYVQEPGEWTHGKPETLLGYTLGANYNRGKDCPDPLRCDVERTTWREHGWGDCDDVAQLAAAGALAIGMRRVLFRVARWDGGAHVAAFVETPSGEWLSVDPVGHPKHPFGWALVPRGGTVGFFDLHGRQVPAPGAAASRGPATMHTALSGPQGIAPVRVRRPHVVVTRPGDHRGSRVLGIPMWHYRLMKRGAVVDGTPAIDQYGEEYEYLAAADLWAPLGAPRRRRKAKRQARRRGRRRRFRRKWAAASRKIAKSKVYRGWLKAKAKIMSNPAVQRLAATALQAFGVPPQATRAALMREASIAKQGGRAVLSEMLAKGDRKGAAAFLLKGVRAGGQAWKMKIPKGGGGGGGMSFRGDDGDDEGQPFVIVQDGATYEAANVEAFEGLAGVVEFGMVEAKTTVEPGTFYAIQSGDTLLSIGQRLNDGKRSGGPFGSRLKAAQVIAAAAYNRRFSRPPKSDFEKSYFKDGITILNPSFSEDQALAAGQSRAASGHKFANLWMPATVDGSDNPPELCPPGMSWDGATDTCMVLPSPGPVEPSPPVVEPVEPVDPVITKPLPPEPEPEKPAPPIQPLPPAPGSSCPEWFKPSPSGSGACVPALPCPDGMAWRSVAQGGPAPVGGCVRVAPSPTPQPPAPAPTPPTPSGCPPGTVQHPKTGACFTPPAPKPYSCPPGTVFSEARQSCIKAIDAPKPPIVEPEEPLPPVVGPAGVPPPGAERGTGAFPWIALIALLGAS